jgi:hypothetical protein
MHLSASPSTTTYDAANSTPKLHLSFAKAPANFIVANYVPYDPDSQTTSLSNEYDYTSEVVVEWRLFNEKNTELSVKAMRIPSGPI